VDDNQNTLQLRHKNSLLPSLQIMDPRETILFSPRKKHQLIILYVLFVGIYYFFNNIIIMFLFLRTVVAHSIFSPRTIGSGSCIGFSLVQHVGSVGPVFVQLTSTRISAMYCRHARTVNTRTSLTYLPIHKKYT